MAAMLSQCHSVPVHSCKDSTVQKQKKPTSSKYMNKIKYITMDQVEPASGGGPVKWFKENGI